MELFSIRIQRTFQLVSTPDVGLLHKITAKPEVCVVFFVILRYN